MAGFAATCHGNRLTGYRDELDREHQNPLLPYPAGVLTRKSPWDKEKK
jgi:hypothetical protein